MIQKYFDALLLMTAEMAPYLLLGFFIAGILRVFVPRKLYANHLAPRNLKSVIKAAAIGVPLPLCSCGVIPTTVGLRKEGASHGACTSFLIATPQTGVDSIAATYSLMGLPFAIVRPVAALVTAIFGGWLVNRVDAPADPESTPVRLSSGPKPAPAQAQGEEEKENHTDCHSHSNPLHELFHYAFVEMMQDVGKWLVVGLLIAALITVAVPNEWLAALHEYKLLNMMIVLAIAIPMYVCATGSIPIAVSLMAKGLTPGAALVLLMAGPAVNTASLLVIGKTFGRRTLVCYLIAIVLGAILFGLAIDYLLPQQWFAVQGAFAATADHGVHSLTTWDWCWIVLLVALLVNAFILHFTSHSSCSCCHTESSCSCGHSDSSCSCGHSDTHSHHSCCHCHEEQ